MIECSFRWVLIDDMWQIATIERDGSFEFFYLAGDCESFEMDDEIVEDWGDFIPCPYGEN